MRLPLSDDPKGPGWLALVLVGLLLASRLLVIPAQPWEQDEALFAAAAFDTDVVNHRPHPPGFPLWIAVGKLGDVLLGDPVRTLELASALASVITVLLLARILAGLVGWRLGWAAALLYGFTPGVWFHAPRAFSTTPALAAAVAAVAVWHRPGRPAWYAGCALLGVAVLVRPPLLPALVALGAAAAHLRGERLRSLVTGAAAAAAVIAAGFVPLVIDTGGVGRLLAAVAEHGSAHGGALHLATWRPDRLGLVRAMGGVLPSSAAAVLAGLGLLSEARRRPRLAGWGAALLALATAWLLLAHNRTYPRYALPVLAVAVGPVALGLKRLTGSPSRAAAAATAAALAGACWTAPAMTAQVAAPFPPLAAMAAAQAVPGAREVLVEAPVSPFGDLMNLAKRRNLPYLSLPLLAEGRILDDELGGAWVVVGTAGATAHLVPAPGNSIVRFDEASPRLAALAQDRYLSAWAAPRGGIALNSTTGAEPGPVAISQPLDLLLQPTPPGSWLGLVLEAPGEPARLELRVNGTRLASRTLTPGRHRYELPLPGARERAGSTTSPTRAQLVPLGAGHARLVRIWVDPPDGSFTPPRIPPAALDGGVDSLADSGGLWPPEPALGTPPRAARWTGSEAWLSLPAGRGRLILTLCAPRPEPARVVVTAKALGYRVERSVGPGWVRIAIPVTRPTARLRVRLTTTNPFTPGGADARTLGVAVGEVRFERAR